MSQLAIERGSSGLPDGEWVELASKRRDAYVAVLKTLGAEALAHTPAVVDIYLAREGSYVHREGLLQEMAEVYTHPMVFVSHEEAMLAYPPRNGIAA